MSSYPCWKAKDKKKNCMCDSAPLQAVGSPSSPIDSGALISHHNHPLRRQSQSQTLWPWTQPPITTNHHHNDQAPQRPSTTTTNHHHDQPPWQPIITCRPTTTSTTTTISRTTNADNQRRPTTSTTRTHKILTTIMTITNIPTNQPVFGPKTRPLIRFFFY